MIAAVSPDIQVGLKGLKKINIAADVQTGKNVLGAWGFGTNIYFADNVSLPGWPGVLPGQEPAAGRHQVHVDGAARYRYPSGSLRIGTVSVIDRKAG